MGTDDASHLSQEQVICFLICLLLCFSPFSPLLSARDGTQGLVHAKQGLHF